MVATQSFPRGKKQPPAAAAVVTVPVKSAKKRKHDDAGAALEVDEDQDTGADALFGKKGVAAKSADASAAAAAVKKTKKVVKKPRVDADKDLKDPKEATATAITFKSLRKGALLLGCVRQINDGELLISLPNKLNGIVAAAECSDEFFAYYEKQQDKKQKKRPGIAVPGASFGATKDAEEEEEPAALSSIFQVGQFVPCVVLSAAKESKGKQIYLSLRTSLLHAELLPQTVNKGMTLHGTVASVEDHGAIINLGVRGLNAFVPLKELKTSEITPVKGQHMFVNVLSMNTHTSTATVTPDRSQVVKAVTRGDSFTVKQLVPGMLLNVRVEEVLKNGLSVNFLTFFNATVEQNHMSNPCHLGWEESYKKGLKGRARIISIDFVSKQITLSMAPHVVHLTVTEPSFTIGDIINEATIERIDEGIGMLLSLQKASASGSDMDVDEEADAPTKATWKTFTPAYVHISNVSDNRVDKLEKKFTVGTKIPARVIGFAPFDGLVNVSCKESSLSQTVLRHADLVAGEKLTGTIMKIEPWGILLELSEGVRGVVSPQHVPPFVFLKKTGKKGDSSGKYQVGKKVEARVLRVDMESKKTYLTMKKTLLTSEIPVLASYEDATMGRVAQGYITKIAEYGVVVSFYNGVYGLVPAALLHQAGVVNLEEAYVLGQVVKTVVTRCDVGKKRLMLTFNTAASSGVKASSGASSQEKSELIGKTVKNVKVLDVEATCLRVQTEDGLEGVLPFVQLTDFPRQTALVDELVKQYEAGDAIQEPLLVVSESKDSVLTFSKKPLLMQYAGKSAVLPSSFSDIKEHAVLLGFVASVNAVKGVFIKFLNNLTALAPKAFLSDKFMADIEDGLFEMGETVLCHVEKIEKDKQQFVVGFRRHQELLAGVKDMPSFFQSYLREYTTATNVEAPYTLGKTEKAEFLGMRPYGAVFALEKDDETTTVIVRDVKDSEWEEGASVKLLLVDYDFEKNVYFGSTDSALVKNGSKKARKQKNRLPAGAKIENATVIAVGPTEKYVVVSFADPQNKDLVQFGAVQIADFWCPSQSSSALDLDMGSSIACRLLNPSLSFAKKTPFDGLPLLAREEEGLLTKTKKKKERAPRAEGETVTLPKYKSEDLVLGKILTGRIAVIKENSMEIKVKTSHTCGKVVATVSIVDVDEDKDYPHPFDRFSVNMLVEGRILAVLEKGANQRKPVSESNPANFHALHLSLRKEDLDAKESVKELVRADWQENSAGRALLRNGKSIDGVVVEQSEDGLTVKLSHRVVGYLNALELSNDLDVLREFREKFPVGKRVRCNILNVDEDKNRVDLSIVRSAQSAFKPGSVVNGLITTKVSAAKPPSIMVCLAGQTFGRVCITELLPRSQWKNDMHKLPQFAAGKFVKCVVLSSNGNNIDLSLRQDALDDPAAYIKAPVDEHKVNDLVTAIVVSTTSAGCFLRVGRQTSARAMLRDLSDNFIKDPQAEFQPGKLVAGRVVKKSNRGLELSLKASIVSEDVAVLKFKDLKEGMTVKGTITKVQAYGVFVKIEKSTISGLCHISEIADEKVTQSLDQVFTEGDYVKAKILKIEDLRVSFGLKPSYFEGEESSSEEEDDDEEEESEDEEGTEKMEVDEDDDDEEESEDEEEVAPKVAKRAPPVKVESMDVDEESTSSEDDEPAASAQVGFTWDGFANVLDQKKSNDNDDDSSDDEDDEDANATAKSSKKKTKQNDEWVALREKALASNDEVPQSADDYERLIAVSPQSSFLWIQYMAFHVSLTEIDMARDVAIRATSAVSFRDEKEKLNVWVAYMNLEHDFGDEAAFLRVFNSALKVNHQKRVYLHLVDLYARAQEDDDVEQTLTTMQKKFRKSKQTWLRALQYQVSQKQFGKAAETLQKSLKSLEAHKHLPVILKYGQLMYENGELEKARTIFEGILANYPKRMDLWNVYLDKEIKFGTNVDLVRALFERLIAMDFSAKKMKFLFKKYLQYEQEHGDDDSVEHVKQLAKDFVAQAAAGKLLSLAGVGNAFLQLQQTTRLKQVRGLGRRGDSKALLHVVLMSRGARVGVLSDDELEAKVPGHSEQAPVQNAASNLAEDEQVTPSMVESTIPAAVSPRIRRNTIGGDRLGSRKLSATEHVLIKKTSVLLSNTVARETILTQAELKKLQIFNTKYMGKPLLKSSRSVRWSEATRAQASFSESVVTRGTTDQAYTQSTASAQGLGILAVAESPLWLVKLRERMKGLVKTDAFRATVHFIVIADIAVLALDDDYHNGSAYVSLDIAFTLLIGLEIVLKSIAFGLYSGPESYLKRSRFRILNLIVLAASLVSHLGGAKLRVLRGIKTFRSLTMHSGLRRILRSLIRAIPFLANVGTLALFFLLAFSIFGLEAYHGAYDNRCSVAVEGSNSNIVDTIFEALPRAYCSGNASCAANNQACLPLGPLSKHINFDSGISSIFLVFLVVAQDGWVTDIMKPVLEGTSYWSVAFFVLIIASMVFLVVNLFVAVITTAFMNFTIDAESEEHQPRFMGRMDPDDEETHVSLIMGATLAIEESIHAETVENELLESEDSRHSSRTSAVAGTPLISSSMMLNGAAREAMGMLSNSSQWKSIRDLTAEATKEMIQNPSPLEEFMLPFAKVYQRHASSQKNTHRGSVDEDESSGEAAMDTQRSSNGTTTAHKLAMTLVEIQEHAPFESMNALIVPTGDENSTDSAFAQFQKFVFCKKFDDFITGCIVVNTFFLLLEYPNMNKSLRVTLSVTEYLFGSIFGLEMIVRIIAMKGLRAYLHSTERRFDMVVVVCTTINMVLNNVDINFSGLNSVSSLRTLRVSRLMLKYEGTRKLIESVLKSSRGVMDVVVFLVLFQVVTSILAMQLFGGGHLHSADNTPRWNFDTFGRSFLTLLQVITGDQWSSITYDAVDAENPHWLMIPFLVVVFIIGQYVLLNLFIAVILENFSISEEEAYQLQLAQIIAIPKELDIFEKIEECGVCVFGEMDKLDNVSNVKLRMFLGLDDNHNTAIHSNEASRVSNGRFMHKNGGRNTKAQHSRNILSELNQEIQARWKRFCFRLATSAWFSRLVQIVIVISCANLIIDDPHPEMSLNPPSDELTRALAIMNDMILFILFLEFVVKVGAFGFGFEYLRVSIFHVDERLGYVSKQAYMENKWNQLDFVLLLIAIADAIAMGISPTMRIAGVFRAGRVLRPLRILNHYQEMKAILTAVAQSVPQVGNVFALCMLVYIIFGVVGRSIFAGKLYSCNDPAVKSAAQCVGFFLMFPDGALDLQEATAKGIPGGAILVPRVWSNARFSFDHIGVAFLALLEMTSLKWIDKVFAAMDIVAENKQPVQDHSPMFAVFFVLYVYIGSLFVIRLFVGVLVEQFQRNDGTQILTESQKSWVDLEKFVLLLKPLKLIPRPRLQIQSKLYDFCQHPYFSQVISAAILLNILLLLVNPNSTSTVSTSYKVIEMMFLGIFTIEALLKCLAFRHYYLFSMNGAFEMAILVGSLVAYFSDTGYHSLIQAGRIFRVMRVLRFVKLNKGVYTIFRTFRASLRPIANIFFLMCTIIFIFAIVARQLFGGVKFGPAMNHFSNFRTFGSSVLLLFQIMSGDDWHLTMTDCMVSKPFCSERVDEVTGAVVTDCGNVTSAAAFFVTYVTLVVFVFLNLFVTVILENFRSCYLKSDVCAISLLDFEKYREVFQKYDTQGKGTFPLWQLASFLSELPASLRIERNRKRRAFLQIRSQVQVLLSTEKPKRPYFNELLRVLCIHQMGIRSLPYEQQRDRVKQIFIYRAKVAHMMVESVVKGYVYRWRQRQHRLKNEFRRPSSQQTTDSTKEARLNSALTPPTRDSQLPTHSDIVCCSPEVAIACLSDTHQADTASETPIASESGTKQLEKQQIDENAQEVSPALADENAEVLPPIVEVSEAPQRSKTGRDALEGISPQSDHDQDAKSSHRRHRKHHHHHKKKRHCRHVSGEEVKRPDVLASGNESLELNSQAMAAQLRKSSKEVTDDNGHSTEHLHVKSASHEIDDLGHRDEVVIKKKKEPIHEPSSPHLPARLLKLNGLHHSSKVVPT